MADLTYQGAPQRPNFDWDTSGLHAGIQSQTDTQNYNDQMARNNVLQNLAVLKAKQQQSEFEQQAPTRVLQDLATRTTSQGTIDQAPGITNALNAQNNATVAQQPSKTAAAIRENLDKVDASKRSKVALEADIVARHVPMVNSSPMQAQGYYQDMLDELERSGIDISRYQKQWTPDYGKRLVGLRRAAVQTIKHTQEIENTLIKEEGDTARNKASNATQLQIAREREASDRVEKESVLKADQATTAARLLSPSKRTAEQQIMVEDFIRKTDPVVKSMAESYTNIPFSVKPEEVEGAQQAAIKALEVYVKSRSGVTKEEPKKQSYKGADEVKAAYKAGALSKEAAMKELKDNFGMK